MSARKIPLVVLQSSEFAFLTGGGGDDAKPTASFGHCLGSSWGATPGSHAIFCFQYDRYFHDPVVLVRYARSNPEPPLRLSFWLNDQPLPRPGGETVHVLGSTGGWGESEWHWRMLALDRNVHLKPGTNRIRITSEGKDCWITLDAIIICERADALAMVNLTRAEVEALSRPAAGTFDPVSGRFHDSDAINGVPLGGVGAGKFELLPSLWFANLCLSNNPDAPFRASRATFIALSAQSGEKAAARVLRLNNSWEYENAPNVAHVDYLGLFPRVDASCEDDALGIAVRLEAFSPLVAQDPVQSAIPGARLRVHMTNPNSETARIRLVFGAENLNGRHGYAVRVGEDGRQLETDTSVNGNWVEPIADGRIVGVRLAGDRAPAVDAKANSIGEIVAAAVVTEGVTLGVGCFDPRGDRLSVFGDGRLPLWPLGGRSEPDLDGEREKAGAVWAELTIAPGEVRSVDFIYAWHFPTHVTLKDRKEVGRFYANRFPDALSVASHLAANGDNLYAETRAWQDLLTCSNLPTWLPFKIINGSFPAHSGTMFTRDGRFGVVESPMTMAGALGTMDQRMAAHPFWTALLTDLDRTELELFQACQQADGRITHFTGNYHEAIGDPTVHYGVTDWPDLSASWIMQCFKLWRWTGDKALLKRTWPGVRQALLWLESRDRDGDFIPEGGNTYDYEKAPDGMFIYNASCYLGALRCGAAMAIDAGHDAFAAKCLARLKKAQKSVVKHLWNGAFFRKWKDQEHGTVSENSFIASFAGDWLARFAGAGNAMAWDITKTGLAYLNEKHVKAFPLVPPMEVTPAGKLAVESAYVHQHEPYLGMESIYAGMVAEGIEVLHRNFKVAWVANRMGWNMPLNYHCSSAQPLALWNYMTNTTTWGAPYALAGASLDLPGKALYLNPQAIPGQTTLEMPLFFPGFWLWLKWNQENRKARLTVNRVFTPGIRLQSLRRVLRDGTIDEKKLPKVFKVVEGATLDVVIPNCE